MQLSTYALPAILALLAKAIVFLYARHSKVHNTATQLYLLFLFALALQNVTEIHLFLTNAEDLAHPPGFTGSLYFGASILAIALLLHLALVMATGHGERQQNPSTTVLTFLYTPAVVLNVLLWYTPLLVAGFEPMGYTYIRIPGPLYPLFQIYAIAYLGTAIGVLIYGCHKQTTSFRRLQNKLFLIGLIPTAVLVPTVIVLQSLGFRAVNSTVTVPIALTFFLAITAYATHRYRLFDITFFIPWSKIRKRKTKFYERIKDVIAEIADMSSVNKIVQLLSEALRCPVVLIGGPRPALAMAGEAFGVARFPLDELKKIDQIIVAHEVANTMPSTYALMKRHKVAAIVPFHPHSEAAASWMLLGESFSEHVYTPLDFQVVESLFARLADHFLDKQLLLRSQLSEAQREMQSLRERLATAWTQLEDARKQLRNLEAENLKLQQKNIQLIDIEIASADTLPLEEQFESKRTLEDHNTRFEAHLIRKALEHYDGDVGRAAEQLGVSEMMLRHKIKHHGLTDKTKDKK